MKVPVLLDPKKKTKPKKVAEPLIGVDKPPKNEKVPALFLPKKESDD